MVPSPSGHLERTVIDQLLVLDVRYINSSSKIPVPAAINTGGTRCAISLGYRTLYMDLACVQLGPPIAVNGMARYNPPLSIAQRIVCFCKAHDQVIV